MMKTLVAFQTKSEASRVYAESIAATLVENEFEITVIDLKETIPDISDYDLIIVGTGIRISRIYSKFKKFLKKKELGSKKLALFLSSGTAVEKPEEAIEKWVNPLVAKYGLKPIAIGSFPGTMPDKFKDDKDKGKETLKPEIAKKWTEDLIQELKI